MRALAFLGAAILVGALVKLAIEYSAYRSWDSLEAEVAAWEASASGKFFRYLQEET